MTLGEIKTESLRLMFPDCGFDFVRDNVSELLENPEYSDYVLNMPGAINRCFSNIENKKILPVKSMEIPEESMEVINGMVRIDLHELIPDYYDTSRLVRQLSNPNDPSDFWMYKTNAVFAMEGNTLITEKPHKNEILRVIYHPSIARVTSYTDPETEIEIPDYISTAIPYYVKGDLFRADEPDEAAEARNWYESAVLEIQRRIQTVQTSVQTNYNQVWG